ncbi:MAG TPA: glutamate-5-semialdehyde dehydrogenase [Acidimicrobiaceae bacterium]|nr:glutamate-5-semialdehyde dehydrogenase [Acidimicrobiaceae bacterium]
MGSAGIEALGRRARDASTSLATATTAAKDSALRLAAELLEQGAAEILAANAADVERAEAGDAGETALDRLRLTEARVTAMADGLRQVAGLADPVGEVTEGGLRPNGLRVERVRVPLGVVGIIYENRPNVTSDAAGLCLKAGNATMLRGSSSALESNKAVVAALREGLSKAGLPADAVVLVEDTSHEAAVEFMQLDGVIDCLVPRGGRSLLESVRANASVPVVIDGDGNCHVYVDESADPDMALAIVVNAKTQRPGVCNAAETLLVHRAVAPAFLPRAAEALAGVELVGDEGARACVPAMGPATDDDFATEFLALKLAVGVVDDLAGAIAHIARFGSGHSEAIVTSDVASAERFCREVDAAAVLVNASTRFIDGGELGLGAEVGISTQKLHARGPMGLRELTCVKWVVRGDGQIRR